MCKCVFKFYLVSIQRKIVKHTDIYNYNHELLKMNSSLLSIISVLSWRSGKQFWALKKKKTQKPSRYPLKLSLQDVTVEIRINLLRKKEEKKIYIYIQICTYVLQYLYFPSIPVYHHSPNSIILFLMNFQCMASKF